MVGAAVKDDAVNDDVPLKVDLENPALVITIEILPDAAYLAAGKRPGAGGLPVGITGHGIALLSGGIDSPVAAHRMMRRGLQARFRPLPQSSAGLSSEPRESDRAGGASHPLPGAIDTDAGGVRRHPARNRGARPRPLRVVLYRRFMVRIAEALARRAGARVLVTGESLGQVASQTLENMTVIEEAAALPMVRPLVGMDKNEIVDQARALGTFETSIQPDQDCCSLSFPRIPRPTPTSTRCARSRASRRRNDGGRRRAQGGDRPPQVSVGDGRERTRKGSRCATLSDKVKCVGSGGAHFVPMRPLLRRRARRPPVQASAASAKSQPAQDARPMRPAR